MSRLPAVAVSAVGALELARSGPAAVRSGNAGPQIALGAAFVLAAMEPRWRRPALAARVVAFGLQTLAEIAGSSDRSLARLVPDVGGVVALLSLVRETERAERWESGWSREHTRAARLR